MRTKKILLLLCSLIIAASFTGLASENNTLLNDGESITIYQVPQKPINAPRSVVPFYAEYNDLMNTVMLGCSDSLGDVTVTLESTAGDWYQTVFDTEDGMILIPASGDEGYYTLTIVTSDNTTYQGEFVL